MVRIVKAFRRAVADAGLDSDVTPHTLRHTAASWGMQNGADHGELADYLGMTIETLRRVYGHHDPNYLSDARDAIVRKPNFTERLKATKQEQTSSGIAKLYIQKSLDFSVATLVRDEGVAGSNPATPTKT